MTRTNGNVRFASHRMAEILGFSDSRTTRTIAGQLHLSASAKRRSNPDGQDNCLLEHCPCPVDDAPILHGSLPATLNCGAVEPRRFSVCNFICRGSADEW